jgi:hypothetical protein
MSQVNAEIKGMLTYINTIPEAQDVEASLMIQRILNELERFSHFPLVMDAKAQASIEERFEILNKRLNIRKNTP